MGKNTYNYLRISVTDKCNLNCLYCRPKERVRKMAHHDLLRYEEMVDFVSLLAGLGVKYVRLTGGEPLVRRGLPVLIGKLKEVPGIEEVSMTTNGLLFADYAEELKDAGLDRVNISLDTLKPGRFEYLTQVNPVGCGGLEPVWRAIMRAIELGLAPKINVVLFEGINDDELFDFAELTRKYDLTVRFIEYMGRPEGRNGFRFVSNHEVFERLRGRYRFSGGEKGSGGHYGFFKGNGPAKYIRLPGAKGCLGFISPNTDCFCDDCNRLRLSCDGKLYPCLFSPHYLDVRGLVRGGAGGETIRGEVGRLMEAKPRFTYRDRGKNSPSNLDMCYFGG